LIFKNAYLEEKNANNQVVVKEDLYKHVPKPQEGQEGYILRIQEGEWTAYEIAYAEDGGDL
jgi:hypothetical protein